MTKPLTVTDFFKLFPDDDACLAHLLAVRYGLSPVCPKCGQIGTFHKLSKMPAYTCNCGHHIHPMVDTPFYRSRTPLQKWFFAMFLFTTTRNGVAAKEIQRQIGVTYKTAWRMARLIREYMGYVDGDTPVGGPHGRAVEIDEHFVGGKDKGVGPLGDKTIVLGMVERDGEVVTRVIPNRGEFAMTPMISMCVPAPRSRPTNGTATSTSATKATCIRPSTTARKSTFAIASTRTPSKASGRWSGAPSPARTFGFRRSICLSTSARSSTAGTFGSARI